MMGFGQRRGKRGALRLTNTVVANGRFHIMWRPQRDQIPMVTVAGIVRVA